jgi:CO dehydrogenase/acetyl-CoA synthase beta subunit
VFGAFEMHQRFNHLADLVVILKHETNLFVNSVQEEEHDDEEEEEEEEEGHASNGRIVASGQTIPEMRKQAIKTSSSE